MYTDLVAEREKAQASFISKVYGWMALALLVTGLTAFAAAGNAAVVETVIMNRLVFWGLIIGEFALVWYLSSRISTMSGEQAKLLFFVYSMLNGLTLSVIFLVYTSSSIAGTFFITAGTFAVMSAYGYYTKKDLTSMGKILMMALIGIVIATIVNIFLQSSGMNLIISYIGVLVFVGLIAYDTQKLKNIYAGEHNSEEQLKLSILGALTLYLDFINLFLFLLRIFGGRRSD